MANVKHDFTTLIRAARGVHGPFKPSTNVESGGVAAAILSGSGKIYTGVCIDTACSMGFCAEHSAIAEMLKNRESHVVAVVAITTNEKILPPCGRCREFIKQLDPRNLDALLGIGPDSALPLRELLPFPY
jgi:cytidine deaminase